MRSSRFLLALLVAAGCGESAAELAPSGPDAGPGGADAEVSQEHDGGTGVVDGGGADVVADVIVPTDAADAADAPLPCLDKDGDGYGVGAGCLGPDCDDENPLVNPL